MEGMMSDYSKIAEKLRQRLIELEARADSIKDDLRHPLDADFSEKAVDLADDETLEGVDDVLRAEAHQVRAALARIAAETYGTCANCGEVIAQERLEVHPVATYCIKCAA
jgi:RNA polymerase-binding transcription factor DksA